MEACDTIARKKNLRACVEECMFTCAARLGKVPSFNELGDYIDENGKCWNTYSYNYRYYKLFTKELQQRVRSYLQKLKFLCEAGDKYSEQFTELGFSVTVCYANKGCPIEALFVQAAWNKDCPCPYAKQNYFAIYNGIFYAPYEELLKTLEQQGPAKRVLLQRKVKLAEQALAEAKEELASLPIN